MSRHVGRLSLAIALILGPALVVERADLPAAERTDYIEVHGPETAYVPLTETHVKFDGQVRRIAGFTAMVDEGMEECQCPKCCGGTCWTVVYTDLMLPGGPVRILIIIWVKC